MLDPFQVPGHFFPSTGRRQDRDVPADALLRGVAVEALGARVPARDRAVERDADDRVVGRLNDGGEARMILLGLGSGSQRPGQQEQADRQHRAQDGRNQHDARAEVGDPRQGHALGDARRHGPTEVGNGFVR